MTKEEKKKKVKQVLKHLIDEGLVIELPNGTFRMKTKKELKQEMLFVENGFKVND